MNLQELGFTKEELQQRVIDQCVSKLLESTGWDMESEEEYPTDSSLARSLQTAVKTHVDAKINEIAAQHVLPRVTEMIEGLVLQETNKWGEVKGQKLTFVEYLVQRAEHYILEEVDYEGKSKREKNDSYGWKPSQTRIANLVHEHLAHSIKIAMQDALKIATSSISTGIQETVKIKLAEVQNALAVSVKTK